jgi:hypothetical protein
VGKGRWQGRGEAAGRVDQHQFSGTGGEPDRKQPIRSQCSDGGGGEDPGRFGVFGAVFEQTIDPAGIVAVQVPEAVQIAREYEAVGVGPDRLLDGFRGTAGNHGFIDEPAGGIERGEFQQRSVPRHVGMIPGDECEPAPVRRDPRRCVKVVAAVQYRQRFGADGAAVQRDRHQQVLGFAGPGPLADRDQALSCVVVGEVGEPRGAVASGDPDDAAVGPAVMDVAIPVVDEEDARRGWQIGAAAVLVYAAADVGRRGCEFEDCAVAIAEQGRATGFLRAAFQPVERLATGAQLREPSGARRNRAGVERRWPAAMGQFHAFRLRRARHGFRVGRGS